MGPSMACKEKGTGILPSTSGGNLLTFLLKPESQFPPVISLAKYSLVASQARAKSCRVATQATISVILSQKFQFWQLFSCNFSPLVLPVRGRLHMQFSSHAGDATKFEKIASLP